MSKFLVNFGVYMDNINKRIASAPTARDRQILLGYRAHACREFGDRHEEIFVPELTVANPRYTVRLGRGALKTVVIEGEAVKGFYDMINSQLAIFANENLFINDWGLCSRADLISVMPGTVLVSQGVAVDDPEAHYSETTHIAMFWPYDKEGRLLGEEIFQLEDPIIEKVDPKDMFTREQRNAITNATLAVQF